MNSQFLSEYYDNLVNTQERVRLMEQDVNKLCKTLSKRVGELDSVLSDFYHIVEFVPMSNRDKVKMFNKLRAVLKERREVKDHRIIFDNFKSKQFKFDLTSEQQNAEKRRQEYRQQSIKSVKEWLK